MPGLLRQRSGNRDERVEQRPLHSETDDESNPEVGTVGRGRVISRDWVLHVLLKRTKLPPPIQFELTSLHIDVVTLSPLVFTYSSPYHHLPYSTLDYNSILAQSTTDPHYEWTHWRMPGEDDQGQAGHQQLYEHELDSDSEFSYDGDYIEDGLREESMEDHSTTPGASLLLERSPTVTSIKLEWDPDIDLADRVREKRHDGADTSFQLDRRIMREIVKEKLGHEVARIRFISSGTFHKAYLITLTTSEALILRVARRFMPRLKVESEVATMAYLRNYTKIPVPEVFAWDSNPFNRLGGEWIMMSRAPGIPLRKVFFSMPLEQLCELLRNIAELLVPLFGHRFSHIGSLYFDEGKFGSEVKAPEMKGNVLNGGSKEDDDHGHIPTPRASAKRINSSELVSGLSARTLSASSLGLPTPRPGRAQFSLSPGPLTRHHSYFAYKSTSTDNLPQHFHVGPIVSWPFFGSHRGELSHTSFPPEIERGPWTSSAQYYRACVNREVMGISRENEGRSKPHRLHLDPDDVMPRNGKNSKKGEFVWGYGYVKRARLGGFGEEEEEEEMQDDAVSDSISDDRDSEEESDIGSPALSISSDLDEEVMYRDYRRFQRSTFLVAELARREKRVRSELERWRKCMISLENVLKDVVEKVHANEGRHKEGVGGCYDEELFGLDCHDLSLDNVFVDERDPSKITCIIDWESTTTRPLWACAHLPSFLLASPFCSNLFRKTIASLPADQFPNASEWLLLERVGAPLRYAHKCVEWDGWEEGLVGSILGTEDHEIEDAHVPVPALALALAAPEPKEFWEEEDWEEPLVTQMRLVFNRITGDSANRTGATTYQGVGKLSPRGIRRASVSSVGSEVEERMLNVHGDICGGRGGELGRRLEAWLIETSPERGTKKLK